MEKKKTYSTGSGVCGAARKAPPRRADARFKNADASTAFLARLSAKQKVLMCAKRSDACPVDMRLAEAAYTLVDGADV